MFLGSLKAVGDGGGGVLFKDFYVNRPTLQALCFLRRADGERV